jgi:hypothetical protein
MPTAVPGPCGTVMVMWTLTANLSGFDGFSAALLAMFMGTAAAPSWLPT